MYKVKGSKHFGYAFPVWNEAEIKNHLEQIRILHHAARHHCYAFRLGLDKAHYRANDDGEPSNSAGKPILGQIESFDLTNILIVVVRYFGGTKLGVGGLIDAYRTAARMAISNGEIVEVQVTKVYQINFPYSQMSSVMGFLKKWELPQIKQNFDVECTLQTEIRLGDSEMFEEFFEDLEESKAALLAIK
ncbi:MAG: putative YigZ family protein [Flavobacteriales bacterium]|jgi:uncharacterized YigZ family protein